MYHTLVSKRSAAVYEVACGNFAVDGFGDLEEMLSMGNK